MSDALLTVRDLATVFANGEQPPITAVNKVSFSIRRGETFALVGESGSGKSVTALSVLRLLPLNARIVSGQVDFASTDLFRLPERAMSSIRGGRIGVIFQDPMTSLNPVLTIAQQIGESLRLHQGLSGKAQFKRIIELLEQVGLPDPQDKANVYSHQLSGGQRQRIMIAMALAGEPELLIADEPTTALDVTIQAQILQLLKDIQQRNGMALWLITHDLGIVADMADKVAVMQRGELVEQASTADFFRHPQHPYSQALYAAMPVMRPQAARATAAKTALLKVENFRVYYPIKRGVFQRVVDHVRAVDDVSFTLPAGRTLALVGESGCGKTTLGKGLLNLLPMHGGQIHFEQQPVHTLTGKARRALCANMQIIFQDPYSAMNPRLLVGDIIAEGLQALKPQMPAAERTERVACLLEQVGLPSNSRWRYPHEFSGGQRQRICIARALALQPKLIVCDEPTSALDVSVQAQIIRLLKELQEQHGLSYLFISHDLAVVAELADEVAVMYRGKIVELGPTQQVLFQPQHPYTQNLLQAVPKLKRGVR